MAKDTEAEGTDKATEGTEGAEEEASKDGGVEFEGEFDAERAKRAIQNSRDSEKKLKAKLAKKDEALAKYLAADEAAAEAEKSAEQKLDEREEKLKQREIAAELRDVKTDFVAKAKERGYADPSLAFVAAKEQGLLGTYNRKTGKVGDHDFEALEESHTTFAAEAGRSGEQATGDAGARGAGSTKSVGSQFNAKVRDSILRR